MRPASTLLLAVLACAGSAGSSERPAARAALADRVQDVTPDGDLKLASGGPARLTGLRLPEMPWREEALILLRRQVGREVRVIGPEIRDRWGRRPVRLLVIPDASQEAQEEALEKTLADLGGALVGAGLALVDPAQEADPYQQRLLRLEATARIQGLGLWAGDRYTPIPVADLARLKGLIGRFVLVEGQVRSIGERPQQTYLNFSSDWASDFTVIVPRRVWNELIERGLTAPVLKGRFIRARGVLEERQGPALTAASPETIEVMEERHGPAAP